MAAAAVGVPQAGEGGEAVLNQAAIDLLRKLPGVTDANYRPLMAGLGSLSALADASLEQLEALMGGRRAAQALHDFVHAPCPVSVA